MFYDASILVYRILKKKSARVGSTLYFGNLQPIFHTSVHVMYGALNCQTAGWNELYLRYDSLLMYLLFFWSLLLYCRGLSRLQFQFEQLN